VINELLCGVALAIGGVAVVACNPILTAESPAPPGRTARLDEVLGFFDQVKSYELELSQGAAMAVSCNQGGPCTHLKLTSDDPSMVDIRTASLDVLRPSGIHGNAATASAVVIVGKAPGVTKLHLHSDEGSREIAVTIVPQPEATAAKAAAR
jgi:hypothetical protein